MKILCYFKFLKYCEKNGCVIIKNKYSMCSVNICLKNNIDKYIPFAINKPPFTYHDLQYFLMAFNKYKVLDFKNLITECEKKRTDICPLTEFEEKIAKILTTEYHCKP